MDRYFILLINYIASKKQMCLLLYPYNNLI